jgi:hypothetical protein
MGMKLCVTHCGRREGNRGRCITRSFMIAALHTECYLGGQRKKNKMRWAWKGNLGKRDYLEDVRIGGRTKLRS